MVNIKPFRGLRYNAAKAGDFGLLISPPYDVLSDADRDRYYKKSEYNIVRIILNKEEKADNGENKYTRASKFFSEWQKNMVFERDKEESLYIYSQKYSINGVEFIRTGFIALIELEELGKGVLPHEKTFPKAIEDRLSLMRAAKANLEQIFLMYDDKQLVIDKIMNAEMERKPDLEGYDEYGITHSLWALKDKQAINQILTEMKQYQAIIADGHHRYKTALKYRDEHKEEKNAKYAMMTFINSFNSGLFILPTHRLIYGLAELNFDSFLNKLRANFEVNEVKNQEEMISIIEKTPVLLDKEKNIKNHIFGLHHKQSGNNFILKLKNPKVMDNLYPAASDIYRRLDVNILHKLIIEQIIGLSEDEQCKGEKIDMVKGTFEALNKLKSDDKYQIGLFLNPPLMREVFLTARANEVMPHKSTYFYPKIYSGIVINKIE